MNYAQRNRSKLGGGHTLTSLPVQVEPERVPSNVLKRPLKLSPMKRIKRS